MSHDFPISYECGVCGKEVHSCEPIEDEYDGTWLCEKCAETYTSEDEILSRAISHYGEPAQVLKCIEELAELGVELITALSGDAHYFRIDAVELTRCLNIVIDLCRYDLPSDTSGITVRKLSETDIHDIASELADVSITTLQMLKIFNCSEEVEKIKQEKLCRLEARMRPSNPLDCESIGEDETFEDIHGPVDGGDSQ